MTDVVPLTRNLDEFQAKLDAVEEDGGGDTLRNFMAALYDAVNSMAWNEKGNYGFPHHY